MMATRTMPCRVCGKQFVPCGKSSKEIGAFNYMEVACSPECGTEYLKRVIASRSGGVEKKAEVKAEKTANKVVLDEKKLHVKKQNTMEDGR